VAGLTLDTGALIAIDRGDHGVRAWLERAYRRGQVPTVPTVTIAQAWRDGRRQARLATFLARARIEQLDLDLARRAGELQGRTGTRDPVDAVVAVSAARRGDRVLTSDAEDLLALAHDLGTITIHRV
jgi:predicted nucleic acid-binding protein